MLKTAEMPPDVAAAFEALPAQARPRLFALRDLILRVAEETDGVGEIIETLKWGEPSYLTVRPKSGSTVRLGVSKDDRPALFCHCQTSLIADFRTRYPTSFDYEGNRGLVLKDGEDIPQAELEHCIAMALTYHKRKKATVAGG